MSGDVHVRFRERLGVRFPRATRHTVGPISEQPTLLPESLVHATHRLSHRPDPHTMVPRVETGRGVAEDAVGNLSRGFVADLMAVHAPRDGAAQRLLGELTLRELDHREPPRGRIDRGRGSRIGCHDALQVEQLSGRCRHARRIDQPVPPHEHLIGRLGEIRQHVASLIIGGHDADEPSGQIGCFGHDPDAGFGALGTRHDPPDVIGIDLDPVAAVLSPARAARHRCQCPRDGSS